MSLYCRHGQIYNTCSRCKIQVCQREDSLYLDNQQLELRVRKDTPDWWIWDLAPATMASFLDLVGDDFADKAIVFEEVVVLPRSDDVLSSSLMFGAGRFFGVADEPCWSFSASINVNMFPTTINLGFKECVLGSFSIYCNGRLIGYDITSENTTDILISKPARYTLVAKIAMAPCFIIISVSKSNTALQ